MGSGERVSGPRPPLPGASVLCVMGAVGTLGPVPGWGLGLAKSASPQTQEVAFQLAQNWIRTNFDVYSQKSVMYEKVSSAGVTPSRTGVFSPGVEGRSRAVAAPSGHPWALQGPGLRRSDCSLQVVSLGLAWWRVGPQPDLLSILLAPV